MMTSPPWLYDLCVLYRKTYMINLNIVIHYFFEGYPSASFNLYHVKDWKQWQAFNQKSFGAGEVSWNESALIKILYTTLHKMAPQGKMLEFSPNWSKNCISNETFNPQMNISEYFFSKNQDTLSKFSKTGRRGLVSYLCAWLNGFLLKLVNCFRLT